MANAITSLNSTENLQTTKIYYSSTSASVLNFSEYVKNYDNIRQIIWCGSGNNVIAIFNYQDYLDNLNANNPEPVRINIFGKSSGGDVMSGTPVYATPNNLTEYYYFDKNEWDAGGDLTLYRYSGSLALPMSYARNSRYVYLVYKKEDTE